MGYTTEFKGVLAFTQELTASQLAAVQRIRGQDCRDHPEWDAPDLFYIALELTDDFAGLQWDGSEKTYNMEKLVNVVLKVMRKTWPEFGLKGCMVAQGEEVDDRWTLTIGADGWAHKTPVPVVGDTIICPECKHKWVVQAQEEAPDAD